MCLSVGLLSSQPTTESSDPFIHPRINVICAMLERKPANSAHELDMREDENENDKLLCSLDNNKRSSKKGVIKPLMTKTLHLWLLRDLPTSSGRTATQEKKDPQCNCILEQEVARDPRDQTDKTSICGKKTEGEPVRNISNKSCHARNFKDLQLKTLPYVHRCSWKNL